MFKKFNQYKLILLSLILTFGIFGFFSPQKIHADDTLNIVQVSDVHLAPCAKTTGKRMLGESVNIFQKAISQINSLNNVDLVVFSGDVVNRSHKDDFLKFISMANNLKTVWLYAPGNHDVGILGGLSRTDIVNTLLEKSPYFKNLCLYYSYCPKKGFLILFLDGVIDDKITANGYFPNEELKWMETQIKCNPDKKIIIVQHFPVVEPFKSNTHYVNNASEYLGIIDKYSNVVAVLSGHYHGAKVTRRNNVLHISTPALAEYPNAFNQIKITPQPNGAIFDIKPFEIRWSKNSNF